jgi:hypothetical protein
VRLLLAHAHDLAARELAARWGDAAVLLTPAELHGERLLLQLDHTGDARADMPSRREVTSVLSRLGGVGPEDLRHVDPQDRTYAAAELDAFLRAWLTAWTGPVANRPSTTCLNGPGWRPEQWVAAVAARGLAVRPVRRAVARDAVPDRHPPEPVTQTRVTVVGDRWFGPVDDARGSSLCALARAAGCTILETLLDGDVVVRVSAWADLASPDVVDALAQYLDGAR